MVIGALPMVLFRLCTPRPANSRLKILLLFVSINDDFIADILFMPFNTCASMASSSLRATFICLHSFAPLSDSQILPGTVIGLKNNLPNLASAYDTHRRVASTVGIFCSMYCTALLLRDACSNELCQLFICKS